MNYEKALVNIVVGSAFLVLFLPLVVMHGMFFPFITGKAFLFRILVEIGFFAWCYLALIKPEYRPSRSVIFWSVCVFILAATISTIFSVNPYRSFWSNFERMEGLITHLHLFGFFLFTTSIFSIKKLWNKFFITSLLVSVIVGIFGLVQVFGHATINQGGVRVDATFGNAIYLAIYTVFHFFLAVFFLLRESSFNKKIFYGFVALLNVFILYFTATRGAVLGLFAGLVLSILLITILDRENKKLRKVGFTVLALILFIIVGFIFVKETAYVKESPVLSRFANISLTDRTTEARLIIWKSSLYGFVKKPILGWGLGNYNQVFNENYDPRLWRQETWFDRGHNVIVDWMISGGLLGVFSYLSLFASALYVLWRKSTSFSVAKKSIVTGLFVAYFFHNLFVFDNLMSYVMFFALLSYLNSEKKEDLKEKKLLSEGNIRLSAMFLIVTFIAFMYFLNLKPIYASRILLSGLNPNNNIEERVEAFVKLKEVKTFAIGESSIQAVNMLGSIIDEPTVPIEIKQKMAQSMNDLFNLTLKREGNNAMFQYIFGRALSRFQSEWPRAEVHLQKALSLSPNKQVIMAELASLYMNMGNKEKSLELMKKSFELDTDFEEMRLAYGFTAIVFDETGIAEEVLTPIYGSISAPSMNYVNYFISKKKYNLAIDSLNNMIKKDPKFKESGERIIDDIRAGLI